MLPRTFALMYGLRASNARPYVLCSQKFKKAVSLSSRMVYWWQYIKICRGGGSTETWSIKAITKNWAASRIFWGN